MWFLDLVLLKGRDYAEPRLLETPCTRMQRSGARAFTASDLKNKEEKAEQAAVGE
jgi:hypothetical protein